MPPRLPSQLRNLPKSTTSSPTAAIITNTTTPIIRRSLAAHSHTEGHPEEMYDPPSGWLFGVPPGEKHKKEGWETVSYIGIVGSLVAATVAYAYKPDTSYVSFFFFSFFFVSFILFVRSIYLILFFFIHCIFCSRYRLIVGDTCWG